MVDGPAPELRAVPEPIREWNDDFDDASIGEAGSGPAA
jgi:hypothetical protein